MAATSVRRYADRAIHNLQEICGSVSASRVCKHQAVSTSRRRRPGSQVQSGSSSAALTMPVFRDRLAHISLSLSSRARPEGFSPNETGDFIHSVKRRLCHAPACAR